MKARRAVGVLGGTFDPIHRGHLDIAHACSRALALDEVRFLPSRTPPHKSAPDASGYHRHAMVALATADVPAFVADPLELERGGVSFTVDTLSKLKRDDPTASLFFLTGMDSLRDLRTWRRWEEILDLSTFVACERVGVDASAILPGWAEDVAAGRILGLAHEPPPFASSEIRAAFLAGRSLPDALPQLVHEYVDKHLALHAEVRPVRNQE